MNEWQSLLQKRNDVPSVATSFDSGIDTANKIRENQLANRKAYEINSMNEALGQAFKGMDKDGNPVIDQKVFAQILIDKKLGHLVQPARMDREVAKAKAAKDVAEASMWLDPTQVKAAQDMEKSAQEPQISIPIPQVNLQTPSLIPTIQAPDTKKILQELGQKRDELSKKYASSDKKEDVKYVQQELMRLGLAPALQKNGKPFDDGIKGKETDSVLSKLKLTSSKSLIPPTPTSKTLEADGTISTRESAGIQIGQPKESEVGKQLERLWSKSATPDLEGIMQSNSSGFDLYNMATEPAVKTRAKQLQPALQLAFDRIDESTRAQSSSLSLDPFKRREETRALIKDNQDKKKEAAEKALAQAGSDQSTRNALNAYKLDVTKFGQALAVYKAGEDPKMVTFSDGTVHRLTNEKDAQDFNLRKAQIGRLEAIVESGDYSSIGSTIAAADLLKVAGAPEVESAVASVHRFFPVTVRNSLIDAAKDPKKSLNIVLENITSIPEADSKRLIKALAEEMKKQNEKNALSSESRLQDVATPKKTAKTEIEGKKKARTRKGRES